MAEYSGWVHEAKDSLRLERTIILASRREPVEGTGLPAIIKFALLTP
jgi:hypothetical protein